MLTIPIDLKSKTSLYEQIYQYIKAEIMNGSLKTGERLPSTRSLSGHLQVSRNTIDLAYNQLLSEGYIDAVPKRGYFVNNITDLQIFSSAKKSVDEQKAEPKIKKTNYDFDFSPLAIDLNTFPLHTWQKLTKNVLNDHPSLFKLGESQGDYSFRDAIRTYLHQSRGVNCNCDQIIIGAGVDYLLQLLNQLLDPTDIIAMEDPAYRRARQIFHGFGKRVVPISLDDSGMRIDLLEQSGANIAYVTPSHQYPTGIVMPIKRRLSLLQWANEADNRYIIEDDHDSEFRYKGKPIPSLQGIDSNQKTIYIGTFSRAIAPAIRIGYMVLPEQMLQSYQTHFSYYASTVSRIDQAIMTAFIDQGYFERHLNRMRKTYRNKHDFMLSCLKNYPNHFHILSAYAGLYIVVEFETNLNEAEIIKKAEENSIHLYGLSSHFARIPKSYKPTFLLGFANLSEECIKNGLDALYQSLFKSQ